MQKRENGEYVKLGVTLGAVVAAGLLLFFMIYRFDVVRGILKAVWRLVRPFVNGALMAYLMVPMCNKLERGIKKRVPGARKWAKGLSILISILVFIAVLWLLLYLVVPQIWISIQNIVETFPEKQDAVEAWLSRFVARRYDLVMTLESVLDTISNWVEKWVETKLIPSMQTWAVDFGNWVALMLIALKDLVLGLLISAYVLAIRERLTAQAKLISRSLLKKERAEWLAKELRFADKMFNGFLRGKFVDSAIIGVLCMIGVTLMGIGPTVLVSTIIGVTNIIPFFGPFIGAVPCALLILLESPLKCLYFIIFIIFLQLLDGNFIGPLILGDTTGLPSFWVMFAILFFGGIWGPIGMIVGVPLFAVIYDILRQIIYARLQRRGETELIADYQGVFHRPPDKPRRRRKKPLKDDDPANPEQ
jgi:predicted PurR-regulated permease PerM